MSVFKKGLLWRVEGGKTSYIFGTMHVRDRRAFALYPQLKEYIMSCEAYASEMKLDAQIDLNVNQNALSLDNNKTLKDVLSKGQYEKLNVFLKSHMGIDVINFSRFKPIVLSNIIGESLMSKESAKIQDRVLYQFAAQNGKQLFGIESLEEQLTILNAIPIELQVKGLMQNIKDFEDFQKMIDRIAESYVDQNIRKLHRLSKRASKGIEDLMLYKRNRIMAERIEKLVNQHSIFVAIGAGHLGNKKGVLRLLEKKGFTLTNVID